MSKKPPFWIGPLGALPGVLSIAAGSGCTTADADASCAVGYVRRTTRNLTSSSVMGPSLFIESNFSLCRSGCIRGLNG
ncbi:hypothetical protein BD626DRAFT_478147 [Schizophyllum amplum]|uniref:Secreted protein n=1 Tax=Schizophyllum amplum TaxID=97359 RepID=A0A550D0T7_9AGAR|nr:hypothetical protein BD626DRAFT_478147 [Auriculariopsis ampla]